MRTVLVLAGLLVVGAAPVTAGAQHGAAAPAAHAAEPAKPAAHDVKAAAPKAAAPKAADAHAAARPGAPAAPAKTGKAEAPKGETHAKADASAAKPAATAKKSAPRNDLEAAFERIAQKIDGAEMTPGGMRISPAGGQPRADAHAVPARAGHGDAVAPRIRLSWRSSVVWPDTLGADDEPAPAANAPRITLAWQ